MLKSVNVFTVFLAVCIVSFVAGCRINDLDHRLDRLEAQATATAKETP